MGRKQEMMSWLLDLSYAFYTLKQGSPRFLHGSQINKLLHGIWKIRIFCLSIITVRLDNANANMDSYE